MSQAKLLNIKIGSSRKLSFWIIALCLTLVVVYIFIPMNWHLKTALILFCGVRALYVFCKHVWRNLPRSVVAMSQLDEDNWQIVTRSGKQLTGYIEGDSFHSSWMLSLHFKVPQRRFHFKVVIFNDAISQEAYRQLRVYLNT